MNITNKTTKLFSILDITEDQAQDLFEVAIMGEDDGDISKSEKETLNNLRQAFLAAGLKRKGEQNAN